MFLFSLIFFLVGGGGGGGYGHRHISGSLNFIKDIFRMFLGQAILIYVRRMYKKLEKTPLHQNVDWNFVKTRPSQLKLTFDTHVFISLVCVFVHETSGIPN